MKICQEKNSIFDTSSELKIEGIKTIFVFGSYTHNAILKDSLLTPLETHKRLSADTQECVFTACVDIFIPVHMHIAPYLLTD